MVLSRLNIQSWTGMRYSRVKHRLHIGGKVTLTRLYALKSASVVIIGWEPVREDA